MRTARAESPTKDRLLDAAERLMLAKGFSATSVEEICDRAKLTKGSFFHYFESKEDLGKATLERYCASNQAKQQACCGKEQDPLKRVYSLIDDAIAMSHACASGQGGCLLGTFAQELSDTHPQIREACAEAFGRWQQALKRDLDDAKAKYAPKTEFDTRSLADHFIAVLEGSMILSKAKQDGKLVEKSLRHFKRYVQQLYGR